MDGPKEKSEGKETTFQLDCNRSQRLETSSSSVSDANMLDHSNKSPQHLKSDVETFFDSETMRSSPILELLSNTLVLDHTLPYLPLSALFALSRTSKPLKALILTTPNVFRYLDLSRCRGAYIPTLAPIDSGGYSWRAERMDENLTEDEFYSGPLRGVISKLARMKILQDVHTLVLDGLASVTHDLVADIVTGDQFNVRILSVRQCVNLNHSKLRQLLSYICRPSRPEGTPRLQGLYVFGQPTLEYERSATQTQPVSQGITMSEGAQLGGVLVDKHHTVPGTDLWYSPNGGRIKEIPERRTAWEETIQACHGIVAFDAVLCTHMHSAMEPHLHEASKEHLALHKPGIAPLAAIALGPNGCASCGRAPQGAPIWGESDYHEFPLLYPPPFSGKIIDAVRPPKGSVSSGQSQQRLIVSCSWCLANRHCDSCHRWWCGVCYNPKQSQKLKDLERLSDAGLSYLPSRSELDGAGSSARGDSVKVFNGLCVENCLVEEMMAGAGSGGMWG